jgi:PIN domain nuclease of toxin-antitoxin system
LPKLAVFDSSAVLAVILNEPGSQKVVSILEGGLLSTVNLAEVHTRLLQRGAAADHAWNRIFSLQCEVCFFSDEQARIAAELMAVTRPFGLSLGDRACLALAIQRKATVYTTDRAWKNLSLGIEIEVIR